MEYGGDATHRSPGLGGVEVAQEARPSGAPGECCTGWQGSHRRRPGFTYWAGMTHV